MRAAERHIREQLDAQRAELRRRRQDAITGEILDLVTGFEATGGERAGGASAARRGMAR
jgi:F-type H+-transporting ATPase subunit gamma